MDIISDIYQIPFTYGFSLPPYTNFMLKHHGKNLFRIQGSFAQ